MHYQEGLSHETLARGGDDLPTEPMVKFAPVGKDGEVFGAIMELSGLRMLLAAAPHDPNVPESLLADSHYRLSELHCRYEDKEKALILGWPHHDVPQRESMVMNWRPPVGGP